MTLDGSVFKPLGLDGTGFVFTAEISPEYADLPPLLDVGGHAIVPLSNAGASSNHDLPFGIAADLPSGLSPDLINVPPSASFPSVPLPPMPGADTFDRIQMDIRGISSAASNAYAASLQESIRQESISWLALFESSSREIDINEAIIRAGSGHALFKEATVFNETMGGTLRYLKDQTAHMGHIITPEGTAMVNTGLGAMGYAVSGALHELPEPVKETFSSVYSAYITPHAATPNQRFFADAALGSAVSAVGGSVLKPPVPKPQKYVGVVKKPSKLSNNLAETFAGGRYTSRVLEKDMILYRAGSSKKEMGNFFSKDKAKSILQARIDKAIMPVWPKGGKSVIDTIYKYEVSAGTIVHSGKISSQGGHFVGGTQQIIIEDQCFKNLKLLKKVTLK